MRFPERQSWIDADMHFQSQIIVVAMSPDLVDGQISLSGGMLNRSKKICRIGMRLSLCLDVDRHITNSLEIKQPAPDLVCDGIRLAHCFLWGYPDVHINGCAASRPPGGAEGGGGGGGGGSYKSPARGPSPGPTGYTSGGSASSKGSKYSAGGTRR